MRLIDIARRAGRGLRNAKGRTVLTSLAIAVGAFTLTASLAAGTGAREYADNLIKSNVDPQSVFIAKDKTLFSANGGDSNGLREYSEDETQFSGLSLKALTEKDIDTIRHTKHVTSVTPNYTVTVQYLTFQGVSKRYKSDVQAYDPNLRSDAAAGSLPRLGQQLKDKTAVVPEAFAKSLGKTPKQLIGTTVTLHVNKALVTPSDDQIQTAFAGGGTAAVQQLVQGESKDVSFTIGAVKADSKVNLSSGSALFISDADARDLSEYITKGTSQYQKYVTATARVEKGTDPAVVKATLETKGLAPRTPKDLQELLFTIVGVLQGIVNVFAVLSLIASVFGIINTQYISVLERTREIGLMKALGMRGRAVSRLFQLEAAWIGFFGGVLGAGLAVIIGTLLNPFISKTLSLGDSHILVFEPIPIAVLILALMFLAMLAGWFPARKAAKLDPIEALRTE